MALGPVVATALALPAISSPLSIESVRVHGCGALMEEREAQTERVGGRDADAPFAGPSGCDKRRLVGKPRPGLDVRCTGSQFERLDGPPSKAIALTLAVLAGTSPSGCPR